MSKILILATAALLVSSISAFADPNLSAGNTDSAVSSKTGNSTNLKRDPQLNDVDSAGHKASDIGTNTAPSTGSSGSSQAADSSTPAPKHMHHHGMRHTAASDNSADKLNACMASGTPTADQERCLHHAENAS